MPRRPSLKSALVGEDLDPAGLVDEIENLRQGTRDQYESEWRFIQGDAIVQTATFEHGLGEIPWMVDVMSSKVDDGKGAIDANADVTVTKTGTTVTVRNDSGSDLYFRVRAM